MQIEKFSMRAQVKSFTYAFNGIKEFIINEHNARIHLTATIAVIIASLIFRISAHEAMMVAIAIGMVWISEMFNTCIEKIMDFITIVKHPEIKLIKDIAAGAVLVSSFAALIIGLIIFIPKII